MIDRTGRVRPMRLARSACDEEFRCIRWGALRRWNACFAGGFVGVGSGMPKEAWTSYQLRKGRICRDDVNGKIRTYLGIAQKMIGRCDDGAMRFWSIGVR